MVEGRNIKLIMVLKTVLMTATTLKSVGDTSIANTDSQVVTMG
jgi:hypothetical protein